MRSSQALMVGQLHKGIDVQLDILSTMKKLSGETFNMSKEISGLPKRIAAALKENV